MRPAVLTAVLLLVDILNTGTVVHGGNFNRFCKLIPSCGDGWKEVDPGRCAKSFLTPKSFNDAQEHCRSLNGDLMRIKGSWKIILMFCLTGVNSPDLQPFWIGAKKTPDGKFRYLDGSEFLTLGCRHQKLDRYKGKDSCIMIDFKRQTWIAARCSEKKGYACIKNK